MLENFSFYLIIILTIVLLIILANKIKVAYPILLVLAGLAISFIPTAPSIIIDPELIFIIFLPPLLFEAAWNTSWKELWKWRRIILSFAFLVVFVTAVSVAFAAQHYIPGFTLALGFVLGGIVSPPDAVSAGAILKFVKVPKRLSSILEGESLLNDASSLIVFQFAMLAVASGTFSLQHASLSFIWMVIGGAGMGLAIGWLLMKVQQHLPTNTQIDIAFSLVTPYVMYILAEEVHGSGVLSVVCGGLFLSYNKFKYLSNQSRIQGHNFWQSLSFLLNGLVFMLIGLDLPQIVSGLGDTSLSQAIGYGILITVVLIVVRIIACYAAVATTLIMRNFITVADATNPGWRTPMLLGWTGMRGVVSLAAALSIPVMMQNDEVFPQRNLILFITFVVILLTLIVQGLTLPYLIKKFDFKENDYTQPEDEVDAFIETELAKMARNYLTKNLTAAQLQEAGYKSLLKHACTNLENNGRFVIVGEVRAHYVKILELQRNWLIATNRATANLDEDIVRKHLHFLDHEEERLQILDGE